MTQQGARTEGPLQRVCRALLGQLCYTGTPLKEEQDISSSNMVLGKGSGDKGAPGVSAALEASAGLSLQVPTPYIKKSSLGAELWQGAETGEGSSPALAAAVPGGPFGLTKPPSPPAPAQLPHEFESLAGHATGSCCIQVRKGPRGSPPISQAFHLTQYLAHAFQRGAPLCSPALMMSEAVEPHAACGVASPPMLAHDARTCEYLTVTHLTPHNASLAVAGLQLGVGAPR